MYRETRNYENVQRACFPGVGLFDTPEVNAEKISLPSQWVEFSAASKEKEPWRTGVHFFIDDYRFERVWQQPERYATMLKRFGAVAGPDFSLYRDFPQAVQIWNHYRRHWLEAYWQMRGVKVIPCVSWSDEQSFAWCFDGDPSGSTVMISSVGTQADSKSKELFLRGYEAMRERLRPSMVLLYGDAPKELSGDVTEVRPFQDRFSCGRSEEVV